MDITKPEFTPANSTSASTPANTEPENAANSIDRVHVNAPEKGAIQIVDVQNAEEIAFNFDLSKIRFSVIDVDLVLLFPDNSKLILPGLAMGLLGAKPPKLRSLNDLIHTQDIVSAISQITLADSTPSVHLASADFLPKKQGGNAADDKATANGSDNSEASPAAENIVVTPVRPTVQIDKSSGTSASGARVEVVEAGSIAGSKMNPASTSGEPPVPKNPPPSSSSQASSAAQGNAPFSLKAAELNIKALAIAESSETPQSNGKILVGGSGAAEAADDASFAAQSARESLAGGSGNDIIYADDPRFANGGSAARLLDVTVTMPSSNITASKVTISGLPVGYSILNADNINGNWVMPVGTTKQNNFKIQLVYAIPDDSVKPDASGFYNRFTMSMSFSGKNDTGDNGTITASTVVGVRDVNSAEDQNFIDPATGRPVVVLYRRPAGNNIDAGSGDDTIFAAAGADSIDGGDGKNFVHYGNSQSGVMASLSTGQGSGGFSDGDRYADIQGIIGSKFNDTLLGDSHDNTFAGNGGADSIDGGDGNDVADYSESNSAVTVNLLTGDGVGGDAQGDKIFNIEAVIGSSKDDILTAGLSGSTLWGGQGNDTLAGFGNNDTLDGGAGNDCIIGTGGSDIMRGGADHDYMLIDQSFLGGGGSIDGGTGSDTLSFAANSGNLTLTSANFANVVTNTEMLDFTSVGTNVTMSLNASDISSITGQALTAGSTTKLDIFQNAGDSISMSAQAGYTFDTSTANGVTTYTLYNNTDPHDPAHQLAQLIVH